MTKHGRVELSYLGEMLVQSSPVERVDAETVHRRERPSNPSPVHRREPPLLQNDHYIDHEVLDRECHDATSEVLRLLGCFEELQRVPVGLRARCRWLLDVHSIARRSQYLCRYYQHRNVLDRLGCATFIKLQKTEIASQRAWHKVARSLDYNPGPGSGKMTWLSFRMMQVALNGNGEYQNADVRPCILAFLHEHKKEREYRASMEPVRMTKVRSVGHAPTRTLNNRVRMIR